MVNLSRPSPEWVGQRRMMWISNTVPISTYPWTSYSGILNVTMAPELGACLYLLRTSVVLEARVGPI
jgi:hypothetical protein